MKRNKDIGIKNQHTWIFRKGDKTNSKITHSEHLYRASVDDRQRHALVLKCWQILSSKTLPSSCTQKWTEKMNCKVLVQNQFCRYCQTGPKKKYHLIDGWGQKKQFCNSKRTTQAQKRVTVYRGQLDMAKAPSGSSSALRTVVLNELKHQISNTPGTRLETVDYMEQLHWDHQTSSQITPPNAIWLSNRVITKWPEVCRCYYNSRKTIKWN